MRLLTNVVLVGCISGCGQGMAIYLVGGLGREECCLL